MEIVLFAQKPGAARSPQNAAYDCTRTRINSEFNYVFKVDNSEYVEEEVK